VAVTASVTLPDQPATGSVDYVTLAGDGYYAPHSMYIVAIAADEDASGGSITLTVNPDPRFAQCATIMSCFDTDTTPKPFQMNLGIERPGQGVFSYVFTRDSADSPTGIQVVGFMPPIFVPQARWEVSVANVDTFALEMRMLVYNFMIDAPKRVPLQFIVTALRSQGAFLN